MGLGTAFCSPKKCIRHNFRQMQDSIANSNIFSPLTTMTNGVWNPDARVYVSWVVHMITAIRTSTWQYYANGAS